MKKKLTLSALKGACVEQRTLFKKLFPNGVVPTVELAEKHASDFCWDWAAGHLLSAPARAKYDRVTASAWAEYDRVTASVRAKYDRVTASARAEYDRVTASAWAEYDRVTASAWAEYNRVTAVAFVTLWNKE